MKTRLKFEQTGGPYGDCTSNYNVKFDGTMTFREFIEEVLKDIREWGDIKIHPKRYVHVIEYSHGKIEKITEEAKSLYDNEIESITANGGWTNMGYYVKLKP